jgi:threonine-phosphate decarboxylase
VVNQLAIHGGQIYQVAKQLGRPVETLIDFSASVNPLGPSGSVLKAMREAVNGCQHYPDPNSEDLRAQLAHEHKISEESILVGNGSAEIIRILPKALGLRHACIVGPTFSEFENSLQLAGVRCTGVNAISAQRYVPPIEEIHGVLEEWKLANGRKNPKPEIQSQAIFICNPNSPTGRRMALRDIRQIADVVNRIGCWIIVDEAFMDWGPSHSLMNHMAKCPRLLILRSFTKFFAIPGIRLGYVVGEATVVETIRKHLPPWSVNHVAQAAGLAALQDSRFRSRSQRFMQQERDRFLRDLRTVPGLRVMPSQANFVMVEIADDLVTEDIVVRLRDEGIVVRNCQTFSGVTQSALRFAVRLKRDNQRLIFILKKIVKDMMR